MSDSNTTNSSRFAAEGKTWEKDLPNASIMKKFFKIYSIGLVDVWAPPGTALKTDAYFWRHQAQISNGIKKQIYHRLGEPNKTASSTNSKTSGTTSTSTTAGGYLFNKMTRTSEMTLGYPEGVGKFYRIPQDDAKIDEKNHRYSSSVIEWQKVNDADGNLRYYSDAMYNPIMPRHMIPEFYDKEDDYYEDEGLIAPFTDSSSDALKMVSLDQMRILRNAIEPTYAYVLDSYSSEFPTYRASYDKRESISQPIIYKGKRSTIASQILATTDDGIDSYQTYYSGDLVYGNVREYFPSGYTWWYINQVMGGRYTTHKGGNYHMDLGPDEETGVNGRRMEAGSGGEYTTSTRTVAKCAVSIYGVLPLDKEIVKAYAIISPSSVDPSKDPIGRSWNGGQEMLCHYHAFTKDHFEDGQRAHRHGRCGWDERHNWDEDGNEEVYDYSGNLVSVVQAQDESNYILWGAYSNKIEDDRGKYYDDGFVDTMVNLPCLYDTEFYRNMGTSKTSVYGYGTNESSVIGYGYAKDAFGSGNPGFVLNDLISFSSVSTETNSRYQYVVVDSENNLILKYPNSVVWKKKTKAEIEKEINRNTFDVEMTASDGTSESKISYTFTQTNTSLSGETIPENAQDITNYFDMSYTNSRGYVYDLYSVDANETSNWTTPVIYQDGDSTSVEIKSSLYSGGRRESQYGTSPRVMDITDIVKKLYDNRIDRIFSCYGGKSLSEIYNYKYYETKLGTCLDCLDKDIQYLNSYFCYESDNRLETISDGYRYPELDDDVSNVPTISTVGDKYELAKKMARVNVIWSGTKLTINDENANYDITFLNEDGESEEVSGTIASQDISTYDDFLEKIVKIVFSKCSKFTRTSYYVIECEYEGDMIINNAENAIYSDIGIVGGTTIFGMQDRILSVSSCYAQYHPRNLETVFNGSGSSTNYKNGIGWKFKTYSLEPQTFVMDLLRAPLCIEERGWREVEGYTDYSSAKCPNKTCKAHTMTCSVAANAAGIYFDGKSDKCPKCGTSLKGAEGVVDVPGDGQKTYDYDELFEQNSLITGLRCVPMESDGIEFNHCTVYCKNSEKDDWIGIWSMKKVNGNYAEYSGNSNGSYSVIEPSSYIKKFTDDFAMKRRSRYVKVELQYDKTDMYHQYKITSLNGYQLHIYGDFMNMGSFSFAGIYARIGNYDNSSPTLSAWYSGLVEDEESSYGDTVRIISAQIVSNTEMLISLNRYYPYSEATSGSVIEESEISHEDLYTSNDAKSGSLYLKFFVPMQIGGLNEFDVLGKAYMSSSDAKDGYYMTATGVYETSSYRFANVSNKFTLPEAPTKIIGVYVGVEGTMDVTLTEVQNEDSVLWSTVSYTGEMLIDGESKSYVETIINGGTYYYDAKYARIVLPTKNSSGVTYSEFGRYIVEYTTTQNEDGSTTTTMSSKTLYDTSRVANSVVVEYMYGNGSEITLEANADGNGPSYMLEKNSIRTIVDTEQFKKTYAGKIYDRENDVVVAAGILPINWICRNNEPCRLSIEAQSSSYTSEGYSYKAGEFRVPKFTGKEIGNVGIEDDKTFVELFGDHCESCFGKCSTEITFTGLPCTVLSGRIRVKALAETPIWSKSSDGTYKKFMEKTGGMDNGMMIFSCSPVSEGIGRVTVCYSKPSILIYAKERNPEG